MNEKKLQEAKQKIYELMKPFIGENKCIDLTAFRKSQPQKYAILPHYFGSVENALTELKLVKVNITRQKGASKDLSLKDKLALDMLDILRKTESFDSIAQKYGVTKSLVSQLHKTLKNATDKILKEEIMEE